MLFPNKSAKEHGKNNPNILFIDNDIYFDYVTSGVKLIDEIQTLLNNINHEFVRYFSKDYENISELLNSKTALDGEKYIYSIGDVFTNLI